jgi:gliding motility-associated-like protein
MKLRVPQIVLLTLILLIFSGSLKTSAQQLIINGDYVQNTVGWTPACDACIAETGYSESSYGGTDSTHVSEVDDQSNYYQDVCILPGYNYVFSLIAGRRTGNGSAPDPEISNIIVQGLDAANNVLATYVNLNYFRVNPMFVLTPVTGIPVISVPAGSGVTRLKVLFSDSTPGGYSTYGMVIDSVSLVFQTPPVITGVDTTCKNTPQTFSINGVTDPTITYNWNFGANATPATSTSPTPSASWSTPGVHQVYCILGNQSCNVDTVLYSIYINQGFFDTLYDTTCPGIPFTFMGNTYMQAGVYTDTLINPSGCDSVFTINLTVSSQPVAPAITGDTTYCMGAPFVPFNVAGQGILWYTSDTGGTGSPTAPTTNTNNAGTYIYYASQTVNGCVSARDSISVSIKNAINTYATHIDPTNCGVCNGAITLYGLPPGQADIVNYLFNGSSQSVAVTSGADSTIIINGLCQGVYNSITVQVGSCPSAAVGPVTLTSPAFIPDFTYAIHYGCNGDTVVYTNTSQDSGIVYYRWDFGDHLFDTAINPTHIYTSQDTFYATLFITNHFCIDSVTDTIPLVHPIKAAFTITGDTSCQGQPVTFANISTGTYPVYLWSFGDGTTDTAANPVHTYNNAGVYNVLLTETDFVPCQDTGSVLVHIDSISGIGLTLSDSVICEGKEITFSGNYSAIGNTGITWNFGDGYTLKNVNPAIHSFDTSGTFTVTLTAGYRACRDTDISEGFTVRPYPMVNIGRDTSMCPNSQPLAITDIANTGNPAAQWLWNTGDTTSGIIAAQPGTYYTTVTIGGCSNTDSIWIRNNCYINIPNAFTPNNDGVNDYFFPRQLLTSGVTAFSMEVYNRWGQKVFETTSTDGRGWDGKFNNELQPEGVFIYIIDVSFKDGQKEHYQGNVSLLN